MIKTSSRSCLSPALWLSPSLFLDSRHSSPPSPCNEAKLWVQACLRLGLARLGEGRGPRDRPSAACCSVCPIREFFIVATSNGFRPTDLHSVVANFIRKLFALARFSPTHPLLSFSFSFLYIRIFEYYCFSCLLFPPYTRSLHCRLLRGQ